MIIIGNNLILGIFSAILKGFELIAKLIYQILAFLKLRLLALYVLICLFVHLVWGTFPKNSFNYDLMIIGGIVIGVASLFVFINSLLKGAKFKFDRGEKKRRDKPAKADKNRVAEPVVYSVQQPVVSAERPAAQAAYEPPVQFEQPVQTVTFAAAVPAKPNYYRVSQNPKYIMAEYPDRCELYYDTGSGMKYIRTDYK